MNGGQPAAEAQVVRQTRGAMQQGWVRILGWFQICGGLLAVVWSVTTRASAPGTATLSLPLITAFAGALSIGAGILLHRAPRVGVPASLGIQLAQIASFNAGWRYVFLAGPKLTWVIASVGTGLYAGGGGLFYLTDAPHDGTLNAIGLAAGVNISIMPSPLATATWAFGINIVAVYFAVRLWMLRSDLRRASEHRTPNVVSSAV